MRPLLVLAVMLLAACGTGTAQPSSSTATSGIEGRTMIDGGCPVIRQGTPCPDKPISARVSVVAAGSTQVIAAMVSDADGHFRIPLRPGQYRVVPANLSGAILPKAPPMDVVVSPGMFTTITVMFDSGIR